MSNFASSWLYTRRQVKVYDECNVSVHYSLRQCLILELEKTIYRTSDAFVAHFTLYLLEQLSVALPLILLTDHLPGPQTVSVWEARGRVLKNLVQRVQSGMQRRHQPLGGLDRSVGSLWVPQRRDGLRPLGPLRLWALEAPLGRGDPAEDVGGQEGDEGVDPHHEVEEEQQHGVQVLLQLHCGWRGQITSRRRVWKDCVLSNRAKMFFRLLLISALFFLRSAFLSLQGKIRSKSWVEKKENINPFRSSNTADVSWLFTPSKSSKLTYWESEAKPFTRKG